MSILYIYKKHLNDNYKIYFVLFIIFLIGIAVGSFTSYKVSDSIKEELTNYFGSFLELLKNQNIDSTQILKVSLIENFKLVFILWILGATVIGIPLIASVLGIRGFIIGFSASLIINISGLKGVIFVLLVILPKEMLMIPSIVSIAVNGVNFSLDIVKSKTKLNKSMGGFIEKFVNYCIRTLIFAIIIIFASFIEAYISSIFAKIIAVN